VWGASWKEEYSNKEGDRGNWDVSGLGRNTGGDKGTKGIKERQKEVEGLRRLRKSFHVKFKGAFTSDYKNNFSKGSLSFLAVLLVIWKCTLAKSHDHYNMDTCSVSGHCCC
jgi:hypothetical protein